LSANASSPFRLQLRRAGRKLERRLPAVEQEDRLEVDAGRPEEPQAALFRPGVRPLVGEDDALFIRLWMQRRDEPAASPPDSVGPDIALRQRPERRLGLADEHAVGKPLPPEPRGVVLALGQGQVDDV
jgi:hypothetical protein